MKQKLFLFCVGLLAASCLFCQAQTPSKVPSITVGYSPMSSYKMFLARRSGDIQFTYKPADIHASVGFEWQRKGVITMLELSYASLTTDSFNDERTEEKLNDAFLPERQEGLQEFMFLAGAGITLNRQRRLQIPIYFFGGPGYVLGNDFHNVTANVGMKARVKFYLTSGLGLFGGYAGHVGFALKQQQDPGHDVETFTHYHIGHGPEFGLILSF